MKNLLPVVALALTGCASRGTIVEERIVEVYIPVAVGCVVDRPQRPANFPGSDLDNLETPAQEIATFGLSAFSWAEYALDLEAATAACPVAE